uniref:WYL domain-containing protein n=1 Tax=uncultured Bacillota bacterium TaxID=344338 RepID=A0A650EQB9_9FIRM|nr:WYL domain-containing protein [uncultured Firmicutes bacterium]
MSSYKELIKNFEKIRAYMREFYVYGFKNRNDYDKKSRRTYDDERRRIESWLGDYMSFVRTPEGKNVFISIDSRVAKHNPFYKALKSKSFTDGDITLHFILLDILYSPEIILSLPEILERIDEYLSGFEMPMMFDESTVRKKLKEYTEQGIIIAEKLVKRMMYKRAKDVDLPDITDALNFYSEIAPCGIIGSFLLDKKDKTTDKFSFKHHYITSAMDSDVLAMLFTAMRKKCAVTVTNMGRRSSEPAKNRIIPLRIFTSVQNGRQHLLAYQPDFNAIKSFRVDYLSDVKLEGATPRFDELRAELGRMQTKMWGVATQRKRYGKEALEHVDFTVKISDKEEHIIRRLNREKRIGTVTKIDDNAYRFSADVYDTNEMIPWIRTFICRITELNFSNKVLEKQFKDDLDAMYRMYNLEEAAK